MKQKIDAQKPVLIDFRRSTKVPPESLSVFKGVLISGLSGSQHIQTSEATDGMVADVIVYLLDEEDLQPDAKRSENLYTEIVTVFDRGKNEVLAPVICVGAYDPESEEATKNRVVRILSNILDSSIWMQYVYVGDKGFLGRFAAALRSIDRRLLDQHVSQEYIELFSRLVKNNRLSNLEHAHDTFIVPFPFHSESRLRKKAEDCYNDELLKGYAGAHWNILIIDDKRIKVEVIEALLKEKGFHVVEKGGTPDDKKLNITLEITESIDTGSRSARSLLQKKCFDLIFLDYLLGQEGEGESGKEDHKEAREYGIKLFKVLHENEGLKKNQLGRYYNSYWLMLISSFYNTFLEEMRDSYPLLDDKWIVQKGGDPINTPELFYFEFVTFLRFQLGKVWPAQVRLEKIWTDILSALLKNPGKGGVKNIALDYLFQLQESWSRYMSYEKSRQDSLLIDSLMRKNKDIAHEYDQVYPHFRKLLDTLAFERPARYSDAESAFIELANYFKHADTKKEELENLKRILVK